MPRPARPWFRFYSEAMESLKVHELPDRLAKPWLLMLCLANVSTPRGRLPTTAKVAFALRVKEEKVDGLIAALSERGFIDFDGSHYVMHQWDEWQHDSDANLTDGRRGRNAVSPPLERAKNAEPPRKERAKNAQRTPLERIEKSREEKEIREEPETEQSNVIPWSLYRDAERCLRRPLSPMEIESLKHLEAEHPKERIAYAMREASDLNKLSVRYIQRVCENQEMNGDNHERPGTANNRGFAPEEGGAFGSVRIPEREFVLD